MDVALPELDPRRHAEDLRQTWQGRMLAYTQRGKMGAVVLSMLAHYFDDTDCMPVLLRAVFPGFQSIRAPFICSCAKVAKNGTVVVDIVGRDERTWKDRVVFRSLDDMKSQLRRLADRMKLSDQERVEFFTVARAWVVADRRLDPAMDARDPDARRLTVH
jgi:hypothetical protein